jgi:WD40 repeat protein
MATTSKTGPEPRPPSGPRLGVSAAGWSEPGPAGGPTAPHPFATPAGERYVELDQLGAGGMGEVALVHDRRLERELAYKRAPLDRSDPEAAARLGREAQITAGLDHPGIVAVYDAGLDDDGRPFYTMRAVRGRSLAQHLAADPGALARRTLVRQLLAVCEAIGYAHERGVIHRDLTPANVMLGDFGEVQVVDWGLAVRRGEDIVERGAGTPGYMSPERRAGRSAGGEPTSDVWALGTMLREVAGPAPLASELTAILARATATEPSARYLDAGALADDLRRYLDGRPVAAYTYSPLELARRALWAWRWPLATLAAALAVGGAVAVGAWQRVERARDRAVSAELAARAALADARTSLGHALAARAVRALEDHAIPEAEALAAQALVAVESPDARGVLAATRAVVAPVDAVHYRLPGCVTVLDADPVDALCVDGDGLVLWSLAGNRVRWRVPGVPHDAVFGPAGTVLVSRLGQGVFALDRATGAERAPMALGGRHVRIALDPSGPRVALFGNRHYTIVDVERQVTLEDAYVCGPGPSLDLDQLALADGRLVAACRDGALWSKRQDQPWRPLGRLDLPEPIDAPTALALRPDGVIAIATSRGWLTTATLEPFAQGPTERARFERVGQLAWSGDRLLVRGDRGGAQVWSTDGSGARLRLPATGNRRIRAHGEELLAIGRGVWRWRTTASTGELGWTANAGISTVAVSPDGRWIAAGLPDGRVELRDTTTGAVRTLALYELAVKQVGFTADGRELVVASAGPDPLRRIDLATGADRPTPTIDIGAVRFAIADDGTVTSFHYGGTRLRWRDDQATSARGAEVIDVVTDPRGVLALASDGAVAQVDGERWTERLRAPGATALIGLADGRIAIGQAGQVVIRSAAATLAALPIDGAGVLDLAASADQRWLAAACTDGAIRIWDLATHELRATLRGHVQRVASVTFDRQGRLWSAGWDGRIRAWDVSAFTIDAAAAAAEVPRRWALDLNDIR